MNENVKQNQPVSLFSFLILRVAGLLNSADFSRSCTLQLQPQLELLLLCSDTSKAPTETVPNSMLGLEIVLSDAANSAQVSSNPWQVKNKVV